MVVHYRTDKSHTAYHLQTHLSLNHIKVLTPSKVVILYRKKHHLMLIDLEKKVIESSALEPDIWF